jgi:hypothetical protein
MKINQLVGLLLVFSMLISVGFLRQCSAPKRAVIYDPSAKYYKSKAGEIIAYNSSLEIELKDLKRERADLMAEVKNMRIKKPQTITRTVTRTEYDTLWMTFETEIPCEDFTSEIVYMDKWIEIYGFVNQDGVMIESIYIPDTVTLVVGQHKRETIIAVKHANPNITVAEVENYVIKRKRFAWKEFAGGFVLGFLTKTHIQWQ